MCRVLVCIGMSYDTNIVENGVGIAAFSDGVNAAAKCFGACFYGSGKYIRRMEEDLTRVNASQKGYGVH